ncbi:MAG: 4Fe-4S binding protein [Bilophila wadsworthia]
MIDFKVDESLCVSCGACVKDCLHQALRMDTYPVMVDEGHCIRCQHCLAVCPTGAVSIMGAAASDCTPLAGNIPEPRQLDTLFKGRRSVRHYKRETFARLLQELLDSAARAYRQQCEICWFRLSTTLRRWMPSGAVYLRLDELAETVPCRTASAARFPFRRKALEGRGWDGISAPLRIA